MSSSGAYAIPIDPAAGGGQGAEIQRVVPLPPVHNTGAISFNLGWLSLAYDNFGTGPASVDVRVRIFNATAGITMDTMMTFPVGRTVVKELDADDLMASFQFIPAVKTQSTRFSRRSWSTTNHEAFSRREVARRP